MVSTNNRGDTKYVYKYLLTVLQDQMINNCSKPLQSESVYTSMLCWCRAHFEHRVIFGVDGLITIWYVEQRGSQIWNVQITNPFDYWTFKKFYPNKGPLTGQMVWIP